MYLFCRRKKKTKQTNKKPHSTEATAMKGFMNHLPSAHCVLPGHVLSSRLALRLATQYISDL